MVVFQNPDSHNPNSHNPDQTAKEERGGGGSIVFIVGGVTPSFARQSPEPQTASKNYIIHLAVPLPLRENVWLSIVHSASGNL